MERTLEARADLGSVGWEIGTREGGPIAASKIKFYLIPISDWSEIIWDKE